MHNTDALFMSIDHFVEALEEDYPPQVIVDVMRDYVELFDEFALAKEINERG